MKSSRASLQASIQEAFVTHHLPLPPPPPPPPAAAAAAAATAPVSFYASVPPACLAVRVRTVDDLSPESQLPSSPPSQRASCFGLALEPKDGGPTPR